MPITDIGDPRLQALFGADDVRNKGVRPTIRLSRKGVPPIMIAGIAVALAILLFAVLNARRTYHSEPPVRASVADAPDTAWAPPPPLYVPPAYDPETPPAIVERPVPQLKPLVAPAPTPSARVVVAPAPAAIPAPQVIVAPAPPPLPQQRVSSGAPLVIDGGGAAAAAPAQASSSANAGDGTSSPSSVRMRASAFANRSMTVPQGYLIPAVLETGFDSTKPGFARAIISRDVHGFDGKNILIPRGSRLVGDYKSAVAQGQNRAVIIWTRLTRPDGMTITLDSPSVDPVGRGGVSASVNSHFMARLANALLQSTVEIGRALAGRSVTGPVVVLQGNAASNAAQILAPVTDYTPTLKVRPGKSISIFVAHDLDFSGGGGSR